MFRPFKADWERQIPENLSQTYKSCVVFPVVVEISTNKLGKLECLCLFLGTVPAGILLNDRHSSYRVGCHIVR